MGIEAICRWGEKILACRDYPSAKEQFGDCRGKLGLRWTEAVCRKAENGRFA